MTFSPSPHIPHFLQFSIITSSIVNDEYAATVDHYREVAESRVQALEGKIYELKRKGDILMEKGKRT